MGFVRCGLYAPRRQPGDGCPTDAARTRGRAGRSQLLAPGGAAARSAHRHDAHDHRLRRLARGHLFDRLYARRSGVPAVLRARRDVRLLDVDAGRRQQLSPGLRVLGSRGGLQLPADRILVHEARSGPRRQESLPRQPRRRFRPRDRRVSALDDLRHARLPRHHLFRRRDHAGHPRADQVGRCCGVCRWRGGHRDLPAPAAGGLRQERATAAARLAARCDGRSHARQRPDPCGDDGDGGHLPDHAVGAAVCRLPRRPHGGIDRRRHDGAGGRPHRHGAERSQAGAGLLHDQPVGLHVRQPRHRHAARLHGGDLPPAHARLLQGAPVSRRRLRDARHGRRDRHAAVRRSAARDADHGGHLSRWFRGARRRGALRRLLQ